MEGGDIHSSSDLRGIIMQMAHLPMKDQFRALSAQMLSRIQDLRVEYFNAFKHPLFGAPGAGFAPFTLPTNASARSSFGKVSVGSTTNAVPGNQNPLRFTLNLHF